VVPIEGADGSPQITGYLADTADEYCDAITRVLVMSQVDRLRIAAAAQRHAAKFSTENFTVGFLEAVGPVVPGGVQQRRSSGGGSAAATQAAAAAAAAVRTGRQQQHHSSSSSSRGGGRRGERREGVETQQ